MHIRRKLFLYLLLFTCFILFTKIYLSNHIEKRFIFSPPKYNFSTLDNYKIGFIKDIKEKNNIITVFIDEVEFYINDEAKKEYLKDNNTVSLDVFGNDYYIRNTSNEITSYELSTDFIINICKFSINSSTNSVELVPISVDTLKNYVDNSKNKNLNDRAFLFWFQIRDHKITNLQMQYTP